MSSRAGFYWKCAGSTYDSTFYILVAALSIFYSFWWSLITFLRKNFGKMKVIVHLIKNRTRKLYFSITKILFKKYCTYLAYMTVCFDFHQKDSGTLLFIFLKWSLLQSFKVFWLFFSMSTIFLISSISLYSIYCYRLKWNKERTIISVITLLLFIRGFWKIISKFFAQISFKYQQIKWSSHQEVKAEAILNYFFRYL